jgi:phage terminase small subunit
MTFPANWVGFGPRLLALHERERRFVWAYVVNSISDKRENGSQAARDAGYSDTKEACKVRAHELLHRDDVLDAIQEVAGRELRGLVVPAVMGMARLLDKPDHPDHFKAVTAVLNRTGFSEKTTVEVHHSGSIELNRTDSALEALAYLKSLDVPREKLVEQFGHSGLARYEKMLEERDAKRSMKVIEHVDTVQPKDDGK